MDQDATPGPTPWRNVQISALHDDDDEGQLATFTHEVWDEHSNCPPFLHAVAPVTVRIIDDDRPGAVPELEIGDAKVTEGGLATFDVTLSTAATGAVTVTYATADGIATAGSDHTSVSATLNFDVGERTKQVEVQTLEDQAREETETFTVRLSAATGATVADGSGTGTIVDDDEPPTLTIEDAAPVQESGTTASGVEQLWERGSTDRTPYDAPGTRLDAQFGYGFGVPGSRDALSLHPTLA